MTDWALAKNVCTAKELEALELRERHGLSQYAIALVLDLSRWSVRERLRNADRKIDIAIRNEEAA